MNVMQYSFTCPLEGCGQKIVVDTTSREEAVDKIANMAKGHLAAAHPDVQKTDEQVHEDINSLTVEEPADSTMSQNPQATSSAQMEESPDDEG